MSPLLLSRGGSQTEDASESPGAGVLGKTQIAGPIPHPATKLLISNSAKGPRNCITKKFQGDADVAG